MTSDQHKEAADPAAYGLQAMDNGMDFPIDSNSPYQLDPETVKADAQGTRIVIHPRFPKLVEAFLDNKRLHGSAVEQAFYNKDWSWRDEVRRLVEARPYVFMGGSDSTVTRSQKRLGDGTEEWDRVGTSDEDQNSSLHLAEYLSYDEIMLGSLLGVSGPSQFFNDGNRYNAGKPGTAGTFEPRGIIMGLVGSRFERMDRMDSALMLRSVKNPRQHPELTNLFLEFFGCEKNPDVHFDRDVYKARIRITADILLAEANERAKDAGKKAWVYVVGFGLGVWAVDSPGQTSMFCQAFFDAIAALGDTLTNVGVVEFGWINPSHDLRGLTYKSPNGANKIKVKFSKRNPAEKLEGSASNHLLCLSYAWDGNAFPGNEYWLGSLTATGDPAAACMSTISHLHNPLVNPGFLDRIKVAGQP